MMKKLILYSYCLLTWFCVSRCQKDGFSTDPNIYLSVSQDTLRFDTVFTTLPQVTQSLKVFNRNDGNIRISHLTLAGGDQSPFKINVNGTPGTDFSDLELDGKDSLYIFVTVKLPAGSGNTPLLNNDSIEYQYNGHSAKVLLYAVGQNAVFLQASTIGKDTTWTNDLPIVLLGDVRVTEAASLKIQKGTRIYSQLGTHLFIDGSLQAIGGFDPAEAILFTNSRLDYPYNEMPGGWGGIVFGQESQNNRLSYVHIRNAVTGISDTARTAALRPTTQPNLELTACELSNCSGQAIFCQNTSAQLTNCLLFNSDVALKAAGGIYNLTFCTLAGYSNAYSFHTDPLLYLADHSEAGVHYDLNINSTNNLVYGDNQSLDELYFDISHPDNVVAKFNNCLIKASAQPSVGHYQDCIWNEDPGFTETDNQRLQYDFHVLAGSPAIGSGSPTAVLFDMEHTARSTQAPTIGCLEFKK